MTIVRASASERGTGETRVATDAAALARVRARQPEAGVRAPARRAAASAHEQACERAGARTSCAPATRRGTGRARAQRRQ